MTPQLVVALWDAVALDASGRLTSAATFVRVLEELRAQVPILLLCGGDQSSSDGQRIRIARLGFIPVMTKWLRNPRAFVRAVRHFLVHELQSTDPAAPLLLVDVSLPNYIAMTVMGHRRVFLYLRGDDVREAYLRRRGLGRLAGILHAVLLGIARRRMISRLPLIGAGAAPVSNHVLRGHKPWPVYPSSLTRAEIEQVAHGTAVRPADSDPVRIVWIGRLVAVKRVDRLIRAAECFARGWPARVELHLYGDGPLRPDLEALARRGGPSLRALFHGTVSSRDIVATLGGALCLALTSAWEGFPKVIPEALSAGVPVVSFDVGSVASLIEARDLGVVVRGGVLALAQAFRTLAESPDTWRLKSANARAAAPDLALDRQCRLLLDHLQARRA